MKKVLFGLMILVLCIAGCQTGPRVVDNQYQVVGYPAFSVDKEFEYLGSPKVADYGRCTGPNCASGFVPPKGNAKSDLFVRKVDDVVKEVVIIQRNQAPGRYYWLALKGNMVDFGGREYREDFFAVTSKEQGGGYAAYLEENGHTMAYQAYETRLLMRNVSDRNRIHIYYSCTEDMLPSSAQGDSKSKYAYLRERFSEVITLPED